VNSFCTHPLALSSRINLHRRTVSELLEYRIYLCTISQRQLYFCFRGQLVSSLSLAALEDFFLLVLLLYYCQGWPTYGHEHELGLLCAPLWGFSSSIVIYLFF
jgi:hypothetical protein